MNNPFLIFALTFVAVTFPLYGFQMYSNKKRDEYIKRNLASNFALIEEYAYRGAVMIIMPNGVIIHEDRTFRVDSKNKIIARRVESDFKAMIRRVERDAIQHWDNNKLSMLFKFKRISK